MSSDPLASLAPFAPSAPSCSPLPRSDVCDKLDSSRVPPVACTSAKACAPSTAALSQAGTDILTEMAAPTRAFHLQGATTVSTDAEIPADDLREMLGVEGLDLLLDQAIGISAPSELATSNNRLLLQALAFQKKRTRVAVVCRCGASGKRVRNCGGATRETVVSSAKYKHLCLDCGRRWLRSRDPLQDGSFEEVESLFSTPEERLLRPKYACGRCGLPKKGHTCRANVLGWEQQRLDDERCDHDELTLPLPRMASPRAFRRRADRPRFARFSELQREENLAVETKNVPRRGATSSGAKPPPTRWDAARVHARLCLRLQRVAMSSADAASNAPYAAVLACCHLYENATSDTTLRLPPTPRDRGMLRECRAMARRWVAALHSPNEAFRCTFACTRRDQCAASAAAALPAAEHLRELEDQHAHGVLCCASAVEALDVDDPLRFLAGVAAHLDVAVVLWDGGHCYRDSAHRHPVLLRCRCLAHHSFGTRKRADAVGRKMVRARMTATEILSFCREDAGVVHLQRRVAPCTTDGSAHLYEPLVAAPGGEETATSEVAIDPAAKARLLLCAPVTPRAIRHPVACASGGAELSAGVVSEGAPEKNESSFPEWLRFRDVYRTDLTFTPVTRVLALGDHLRAARASGHQGLLFVAYARGGRRTFYCKIPFGPITASCLSVAGDFRTELYIDGRWNASVRNAQGASALPPPPVDDGASCACGAFYTKSVTELQCTRCFRWHHATCAFAAENLATARCVESHVERVHKTWVCQLCCDRA